MQSYDFEYTDQKSKLILVLGCIALMLALAWGLNYLDPTEGISANGARYMVLPAIPVFAKMVFAIGIPGVIFLLYYKKVTKQGGAQLDNDSLRFDLGGQQTWISFRDLAFYQTEYFNGPRLTLGLKDGSKLKIVADKSYCHADPFEFFCDSLEYNLEQFAAECSADFVRNPSVFEQNWMLAALVVFSLIMVSVFYYSVVIQNGLTLWFVLQLSLAIPLWQAYFKIQRKEQARLA